MIDACIFTFAICARFPHFTEKWSNSSWCNASLCWSASTILRYISLISAPPGLMKKARLNGIGHFTYFFSPEPHFQSWTWWWESVGEILDNFPFFLYSGCRYKRSKEESGSVWFRRNLDDASKEISLFFKISAPYASRTKSILDNVIVPCSSVIFPI